MVEPVNYPDPLYLRTGNFVSPFLLRSLPFTGIVEEPNAIVIGDQTLASDTPLRVGQRVSVIAGRMYFELYYVEELEAYRHYRQQQSEQKQREEAIKKAEKIAEEKRLSDLFYGQRQIPFQFTIEIKEVLSGLSATSSGNGFRRNTVYHVFTLEPVSSGRITRPANEFLCSPVQAKSGANWSGHLGSSDLNETDGYKRVPTCKRCLEILERFKINS